MRDFLQDLGGFDTAMSTAALAASHDGDVADVAPVQCEKVRLFEVMARLHIDALSRDPDVDPIALCSLASRIERFLLPSLSGQPLRVLGRNIAMRIREEIREEAGRGIAKRVAADLQAIAERAERDGLVRKGTASDMILNRFWDKLELANNRAAKTEDRALADKDLVKLWEAAKTPSEKFIIVLGIELGLRPGEIAAANRDDLVLCDDNGGYGSFYVRFAVKRGVREELPDQAPNVEEPDLDALSGDETDGDAQPDITTKLAAPKNRRAKRYVNFGPEHYALFKALLPLIVDPNGYFVAPSKRDTRKFVSGQTVRRRFSRLCTKAGVTREERLEGGNTVVVAKCSVKMLRRTFAAVQLRANTPEEHIQAALGHGKYRLTANGYGYHLDRAGERPPIAPLRIVAIGSAPNHTRAARGATAKRLPQA